jgi:uncharacterized OB-fold protein
MKFCPECGVVYFTNAQNCWNQKHETGPLPLLCELPLELVLK